MTRLYPILFALLAFSAAHVSAQAPPDGTVTGTGITVLKRSPDFLRLRIDLSVKGKDLKEALTKLKERREAVRSQLATLGADKTTIAFGEPMISNERVDPRRAMEIMVRERVRKKPGKPQPEPVAVALVLKADWPLAGADPEERMLAAHALQEKIKAADLAGLKDAKPTTPQEEEVAEELAGLGDDPREMMRGGPKPGEPVFLFVSKVSAAERSKALADAFHKAKLEAGQLAQAAGMELGALRQLHHQHLSEASSDHEAASIYFNAGYGYPSRMRGSDVDSAAENNEATGTQPTHVTLRLTVNAAFALQTPGNQPRPK